MVVQKGLLGGQLAEEGHLSLRNGSIAIIGLRGVMLLKLIMRMLMGFIQGTAHLIQVALRVHKAVRVLLVRHLVVCAEHLRMVGRRNNGGRLQVVLVLELFRDAVAVACGGRRTAAYSYVSAAR